MPNEDQEFRALKDIEQLLCNFDPDAKMRMLEWLESRIEVELRDRDRKDLPRLLHLAGDQIRELAMEIKDMVDEDDSDRWKKGKVPDGI
jgi:hypothetical protein